MLERQKRYSNTKGVNFDTTFGRTETMIFEFLGVPPLLSWMITGMLLLVSGLMIYQQLRFKFNKECRNCEKITEEKHAILCSACMKEYGELFPKDWSNKK